MKRQIAIAVMFMLFSIGVHANNDPYGRLFTTPDQRARLDNRFDGQGTGNASAPGIAGNDHQDTRPLKLNGTLTSSIGKQEVWINGERQLASGERKSSNVRLLKAGSVRVKPSVSGQAHDMKPGQVLDPNTGKVIEAYQQASTVNNLSQGEDGADTPDTDE